MSFAVLMDLFPKVRLRQTFRTALQAPTPSTTSFRKSPASLFRFPENSNPEAVSPSQASLIVMHSEVAAVRPRRQPRRRRPPQPRHPLPRRAPPLRAPSAFHLQPLPPK